MSLGLSVTGLCSFQSVLACPSDQKGPEDTLHSKWVVSQFPSLGQMEGATHTSTIWEGPEATLSLGYELISLPDYSHRSLLLQGLINTVYSFLGFLHCWLHNFRAYQSSGQMQPETVSWVGGAMTQLMPVYGQTRFHTYEIPPLKIWSRQICILMSSLVSLPPS